MSQPAELTSGTGPAPRGNHHKGGRGGSNSQLYRPGRDEADRARFVSNPRPGGKFNKRNPSNVSESSSSPAPPTILLKSRATAETRSLSPVNHQQPPAGPTTPLKEQAQAFKVPVRRDAPLGSAQLAPILMTSPAKLLGEDFGPILTGSLQDFLSDQQDFLVVACVGAQWAGKSSILSRLAGQEMVFNVAGPAAQMKGSNGTTGLDAFVTKDRIIWLDCQPLMSVALAEKELGKEGSGVEVQSLQLLAFLYCVSHVLLVVQDSLADPNLVRLLQTAEMLKPNLASDDSSQLDALPHLVMAYNRANPADLSSPEILRKAAKFHRLAFQKSRLSVSESLAVLPDNWTDPGALDELKRAILSLPRRPFTLGSSVLSERSWLAFAGKAWEAVRKSSLMMEYARLLQ